MTIIIKSESLGKESKVSREKLRKIMTTVWGWDQGKADSFLVELELFPNMLTLQTDKGEVTLQALV